MARVASGQAAVPGYAEAQRLIQEGRAWEAVSLLEPQAKLHAKDARFHNLLGIALTAAGKPEQANQEFRICTQLDPKFRPAYKNLGINEYVLGKFETADQYLRTAVALGPAEPQLLAFQGELAYQKKNFTEAVAKFQAGSVYTLQNPDFTLHWVESCLATNRASEALQLLESANRQGSTPEWQFRTGVLFASRQHFAEALPYFKAASTAKPEWYEARYNQALCELETRKIPDAIATLQAVPSPREHEWEIDNLLARAYAALEQKQKSLELLQKAIALAPEQEENYLDLANLLIDAAQPTLALQVIEAGLAQKKESPQLHLQKGVILSELGKVEAAQAEFEAAAAAPDSRTLATTALAVSLEEKDTDSALRFFRQNVSQHENDFLFQFLYARLLITHASEAQSSASQDAQKALQRSISLNPHYSKSRVELSKLLIKEGQIPEALQQLETARRLDERNKSVYAQLAIAYRLSGKLDLARAATLKLRELSAADNNSSGRTER